MERCCREEIKALGLHGCVSYLFHLFLACRCLLLFCFRSKRRFVVCVRV